jgi:hypothetical protein
VSETEERTSRYAPEGRAEFARLYLDSLTHSAEEAAQVGRKFQRRSAERRLDQLQAYSVARRRLLVATSFRPPTRVLVLVSACWLAAAATLATAEALRAHTAVRTAANIAVLVASLAWFLVAVLCIPTIGRDLPPPGGAEGD